MSLDIKSDFGDNPAFTLSDKERNYIVSVIQNQISELSQIKSFPSPNEAIANHKRILELMAVVEAFCIEKIWTDKNKSTSIGNV